MTDIKPKKGEKPKKCTGKCKRELPSTMFSDPRESVCVSCKRAAKKQK